MSLSWLESILLDRVGNFEQTDVEGLTILSSQRRILIVSRQV